MIDVALDNLTFKAKGKLDTLADDMDLRATVTVNEDPKYQSFKVSSALMGLALPIRCKGSLAAPKCGADEEGTRKSRRRRVVRQESGSEETSRQGDRRKGARTISRCRALAARDVLNKGKQPPPPPQSP